MSITVGTCAIVPSVPAEDDYLSTVVAGSSAPVWVIGTPRVEDIALDLRITTAGAPGTAVCRYTVDGSTWVEDVAVPVGNVYVRLPSGEFDTNPKPGWGVLQLEGEAGLVVRFPSQSYAVDDRFTWSLTTPFGTPVVTGSDFALELGQVQADADRAEWGFNLALPHPDDSQIAQSVEVLETILSQRYERLAAHVNALAALLATRLS